MPWPFIPSNSTLTGGGSDLATWIIAVSILVSTVLSILAFLGIAQNMQLRVWRTQVEARLRLIAHYMEEVESTARKRLKEAGVDDPDEVIGRVKDFFVISPVTLEPIDVIRRLERILRTGEEHLEKVVSSSVKLSGAQLKNIVTLLSVLNAINLIYKFLRHMLLLGLKTKNTMLVAQAWMLAPLYVRIARSYRDAARTIEKGIPIGDAAGPLVAYRLASQLRELQGFREIVRDTVYGIYELEGRRVVIVKAAGPGSTVGRPGEAVEKLAGDPAIASSLAAIITVDAALKFEGEETGLTAEGSGVAMGDPGPEKIRIERVAARLGVPLYAVAIKMGFEEAITSMTENVLKGVDSALAKTRRLIVEVSRPGDTVIVVGVGNSLGVGVPPRASGG